MTEEEEEEVGDVVMAEEVEIIRTAMDSGGPRFGAIMLGEEEEAPTLSFLASWGGGGGGGGGIIRL